MAQAYKHPGGKVSKSDGSLHRIVRRVYDAQNNIELKPGADQFVQTLCNNWVERLGSCLEPVMSLPNKVKPEEGVTIVEGCIEDDEVGIQEQDDEDEEELQATDKPSGQGRGGRFARATART